MAARGGGTKRRGGRGRPGAAGVSRRDFLRGLGLGGGALGAGLIAAGAAPAKKPAAAAGGVRTLGPGPVAVTFKVNGTSRTVKVEPRVTLLDALRDRLDLTGAKKICDRGECGGCTVLLDGRPVYACMLLAVEARGRSITTVEGLAPEGGLHPVQAAFIEKDALQCGFCTPGFVVAAKALLDEVPRPTLEQVQEGLAGHLCRCGTYPRVCEAVLAAAERGAPSRAAGGRGAAAARSGGTRSKEGSAPARRTAGLTRGGGGMRAGGASRPGGGPAAPEA